MTAESRETFHSASAGATEELADRLGRLLRGGEVVALVGDLGAGKTTFTKGLCRGAGLVETERVSSPSYVLEHIYEARFRIHHFDAYRLESADEFLALGFEEHLGSDREVSIVEWADRVAAALPEDRLLVEFAYSAEESGAGPASEDDLSSVRGGRRIVLSGLESIWEAVLGELAGRVGGQMTDK